jgi:hypothetical protein
VGKHRTRTAAAPRGALICRALQRRMCRGAPLSQQRHAHAACAPALTELRARTEDGRSRSVRVRNSCTGETLTGEDSHRCCPLLLSARVRLSCCLTRCSCGGARCATAARPREAAPRRAALPRACAATARPPQHGGRRAGAGGWRAVANAVREQPDGPGAQRRHVLVARLAARCVTLTLSDGARERPLPLAWRHR